MASCRRSTTAGMALLGRLYGRAFWEAGQGGPGDTGVVLHLGPHHLRARREVGEVLLRLLADAPADDDEVRPQEVFDLAQVLVEPPGVVFPIQVVALAGGVRGPVLGVLAADLDVPELGVGYEPAADEQGRPDAGAQS